MPRSEITIILSRVDFLIFEMQKVISASDNSLIEFRGDLAGLLVVSIAAAYENCIKDTIFEYANKNSRQFGDYTSRRYEYLNSRIKVSDLKEYCKIFHPNCSTEFKNMINNRKKLLIKAGGLDIEKCYSQILDWRNKYAHTGERITTIEEAVKFHRYAKRVIYLFDMAMLKDYEFGGDVTDPFL